MGAKCGSFKFQIGEAITSHDRNLQIIDAEYRQKIKTKNGKQFTANEKFYKYKCLNCGNEDWAVEYSLEEKQHCGCNVCCHPPRKIVCGINDITTTAPWMVKYFANRDKEASKYSKYSNKEVDLICPDCGRVHKKSPLLLYSNGGLSCPCGDGWSYPNKFMYSLLEQLNLDFETEKSFDWSEGRIYDDFIRFNGLKIITEQHGKQHYGKSIIKGSHYRTLEEEKENDLYKNRIALENGIDHYFIIDSSISSIEHMKQSIINSGLLSVLNAEYISDDIWAKCDKFATSNFAKEICEYKSQNKDITLHDIAKKYRVSYQTVLRYIKQGNKFGWCSYELGSDRATTEKIGKIQRGQKPIYCITNNMYYRTANIAALRLSADEKIFYPRQIRQSISRNQNYLGHKFIFVTQEEFNNIKLNSPNNAVGDLFNI